MMNHFPLKKPAKSQVFDRFLVAYRKFFVCSQKVKLLQSARSLDKTVSVNVDVVIDEVNGAQPSPKTLTRLPSFHRKRARVPCPTYLHFLQWSMTTCFVNPRTVWILTINEHNLSHHHDERRPLQSTNVQFVQGNLACFSLLVLLSILSIVGGQREYVELPDSTTTQDTNSTFAQARRTFSTFLPTSRSMAKETAHALWRISRESRDHSFREWRRCPVESNGNGKVGFCERMTFPSFMFFNDSSL